MTALSHTVALNSGETSIPKIVSAIRQIASHPLGYFINGIAKGLDYTQTTSGVPPKDSGLAIGWAANRIILFDNGIDTSGSGFTDGNRSVNAFQVEYHADGSHGIGQAIYGTMWVTGQPAVDDGVLNEWVAGQFIAQVSVNCFGTSTALPDSRGGIFGIGATAIASGSATNISNVTGGEINAGIATGCSSSSFSVLSLVTHSIHAVPGAVYDSILSISKMSGAVGADAGILFNNFNGDHPVASAGTLILTQGSSTITNAIDVSSYTFTGNFLKFSTGDIWSKDGNLITSGFMSAAPASGNAQFFLKAPGTNTNQANFFFQDGSTFPWIISKFADNNLRIVDNINNKVRLYLDTSGNIVFGTNTVLATNATDGFSNISICAGTPTGTPTTFTGHVPLVYDSTNNKLYVYNAAWKGVPLA